MIPVRPQSRRRAFAVIGIVAVLLLGACSGKSKAKSADGSAKSTETTAAANAKCLALPGPQKARVRFVNVYTNSTYPKSDIDVWQGTGGSDPCRKKLTTVPFGTASDYIDVTAGDESGKWSATAFVAGSTDKEHEIVSRSETWSGGERAMLVFEGAKPNDGTPAAAGTIEAFREKDNYGTPSAVFPVPGKASLVIQATALQDVVKNSEWVAGAAGKDGCLKALSDTDTERTFITVAQLLRYTVDPGSLELALYPGDPGNCEGTPAMGPVTVDAKAGSGTFVLAYGSDPQHLALLVLPIA